MKDKELTPNEMICKSYRLSEEDKKISYNTNYNKRRIIKLNKNG